MIALAIRLKDWHIVPVLMALGNTYGLLLVSLLLGYGLVDVPRHMWRKADPQTELRRKQIMAGNADEALFDAVWELQVCWRGKQANNIVKSGRSLLCDYLCV